MFVTVLQGVFFGIRVFEIVGLLKEQPVILELIERGLYLGLVAGRGVMKTGQKDLVGRMNQEETSVSKTGTSRSCIHLQKTCISLIQRYRTGNLEESDTEFDQNSCQ